MKNNQIKSVRDTYRPIEELQFLLRIDAIPLTETIVKRAVEYFIEAARFIENAPLSAFYDKDIEHFNMYMWRIRNHALDIVNSWLRRHNNEVSQDDLVYKSCASIIEAIQLAAIETGTPIQSRPDDKGQPSITIDRNQEDAQSTKTKYNAQMYEEAISSPVLNAIFKHDTNMLKEFIDFCISSSCDADIAHKAYKLDSYITTTGKILYDELFRLKLLNKTWGNWRQALN